MAGYSRRRARSNRGPELSQHFLKSVQTAEALVELANLNPTDLVIEAGPGRGVLTAPLAERASRVIAVEADRTLYKHLLTRFEASRNVTLRCEDFLSYRLPTGGYRFFANIPFSRTADILRKLVFGKSPPTDAHILMESKAATRFLGFPFGGESAFSLMLKARYRISVLAWLGPGAFSPAPKVNTVMLRLQGVDPALLHPSQLAEFDRFSRALFGSHKKSAHAALRTLLPRKTAALLTNDLNFPASAPPSNIGFEHWLAVFRLMKWTRTT